MTACYCDDYEPATMYVATLRTARKAHKCYECHKAINPGEQYEHLVAVWAGDIQTAKTCWRCLDLREYIKAHVPCFCISHGGLLDDARDTVDDYWPEAPGLFMGYGRRVVAIQRRAK